MLADAAGPSRRNGPWSSKSPWGASSGPRTSSPSRPCTSPRTPRRCATPACSTWRRWSPWGPPARPHHGQSAQRRARPLGGAGPGGGLRRSGGAHRAGPGGAGRLTLHTCVNYQIVSQPIYGEHLAWGDTGTVIWANSGGRRPLQLRGRSGRRWHAAITGRVPRYGYHLPEQRRGRALVGCGTTPRTDADWGALGCYVGRAVDDYWQVPVLLLEGSPPVVPSAHRGRAEAARRRPGQLRLPGPLPPGGRHARGPHRRGGLRRAPGRRGADGRARRPGRDATPRSSPRRTRSTWWSSARPSSPARDARPGAPLPGTPGASPDARLSHHQRRRQGRGRPPGLQRHLRRGRGHRAHRGLLLHHDRQGDGAAHGFRTLLTDSAKLANIIAGYGYVPVFRPTEVCVARLHRASGRGRRMGRPGRRERRVSRPRGRWRLVLRGRRAWARGGGEASSPARVSAPATTSTASGGLLPPRPRPLRPQPGGEGAGLHHGQGGIATSWMLLDMVRRGVAPLASSSAPPTR